MLINIDVKKRGIRIFRKKAFFLYALFLSVHLPRSQLNFPPTPAAQTSGACAENASALPEHFDFDLDFAFLSAAKANENIDSTRPPHNPKN